MKTSKNSQVSIREPVLFQKTLQALSLQFYSKSISPEALPEVSTKFFKLNFRNVKNGFFEDSLPTQAMQIIRYNYYTHKHKILYIRYKSTKCC